MRGERVARGCIIMNRRMGVNLDPPRNVREGGENVNKLVAKKRHI